MINYPVIGQVERKNGDKIPLIDIPMISDERWQELAKEKAVDNYIRENGTQPESTEDACRWQREWIRNMID